MNQYCYVIINNAGHSWLMQGGGNSNAGQQEGSAPVLPQLLHEGWSPVRETPMGGGTSALAHALILMEKAAAHKAPATKKRGKR
ncbi:MAG TPA: hypothetical protein VKI17_04505 [Gemmataceae bacterium]|nr:hypothetical protein [Gemmataceae bacterium]